MSAPWYMSLYLYVVSLYTNGAANTFDIILKQFLKSNKLYITLSLSTAMTNYE